MSRFAPSPLIDDRSSKRTKMANQLPEDIADIVSDGDVVLILSGLSSAPDKVIGLRVSSHSLSQASPVFKSLCTSAKQTKTTEDNNAETIISLKDDGGDAIFILCAILHLRNDKLPARLSSTALSNLAKVADKYQCIVAVGRATVQWFDYLYGSTSSSNTWEMVEAAYLLDEPLFFARFSSRWVLQQSLFVRAVPAGSSSETQKLGLFLAEAQIGAQMSIRDDIDSLADANLIAFASDKKHHIDYPPDMSPEPDETDEGRKPGYCRVDCDAAWEYLGALRDAQIFPSTTWQRTNSKANKAFTVGDIVEKIKEFREPDYDNVDHCEFCEDVKVLFTRKLASLRKVHEQRLWGMCLDCYKAGGINPGECRFEHPKQGAQADASHAGGLGTNGL